MEAAAVEAELRAQVEGIEEALAAVGAEEGGGGELEEARASLVEALAELNAALLEVKREQLLTSLSHMESSGAAAAAPPPPAAAPLPPPPAAASAAARGAGAASCSGRAEGGGGSVGAQCRFRHALDGRWYRGRVVGVEEGGAVVRVMFEAPTRQHMLAGARVPASGLRPPRGAGPDWSLGARTVGAQYAAAVVDVGDRVYARPGQQRDSSGAGGLWAACSVVAVDEARGEATVQYEQGGRARVALADVVAEAWDGCSDLEASGSSSTGSSGDSSSSSGSSSGSESEEDEEAGCRGALEAAAAAGSAPSLLRSRKRRRCGEPAPDSTMEHVKAAVEAGVLTDTRHFAQWEQHGRGVASRLMAHMGYTVGSGLGRQRSGIVDPLQVLVLPKQHGLGLGSAGRAMGADGEGGEEEGAAGMAGRPRKRRRHGGARHRHRKEAEARREARDARHAERGAAEARGEAPGLFGFLNSALGDRSGMAAKLRDQQPALYRHTDAPSTSARAPSQKPGGAGGKGGAAAADTRTRLMNQQGKVEQCQARVQHFQQMLVRNAANPSLAKQVKRRLEEVQAELARELAEQARMKGSIKGSENQRKAMKF